MTELGDLYTDFHRIDLGMRGGYGRVAKVSAHQGASDLGRFAFKLMRHENDCQKSLERFKEEQQLLVSIGQDEEAPIPITRIYDSGYVSVELSHILNLQNPPDLKLPIYSVGKKTDDFIQLGDELCSDGKGKWLPYLVVELASFDDNLLRQINHQPKKKDSTTAYYRLPAGEVVAMAIQLLNTVHYLHEKHGLAYMDWKPEHLFWNGFIKQVKLIDWNVTEPLHNGPGKERNIRDDIRLFCGAVLYIGLTFVEPEYPNKPIGPRPTEEFENPVSEIRSRYWTDNPNFYSHETTLDDKIKQIVRRGLNPKEGYETPGELKYVLLEYAKQEWGASESELLPDSTPESQYFKTLAELRTAQHLYLDAQKRLYDLTGMKGVNREFSWLFEVIKRALVNFPGS
jgi:serine/threonine protein kinase